MPANGQVVIADDVHVGANTVIDRGGLTGTEVGSGVRLDNLVHIAHGARIGARTAIAALSGVAGSAVVGDDVLMGGRSAVVDGVQVGDGCHLAAATSVTKSAPPGARLAGTPAVEHRQWVKQVAHTRDLGALAKQVRELAEVVRCLQEELDGLR